MSAKSNKHRNKRVLCSDGIIRASGREAARFEQLRLLERAGQIYKLESQVVYELIPSVRLDGRKKPAIRYVADFRYTVGAAQIVEDCKSPHLRTNPVYRIKKHMMKHFFDIDILET